MEREVEIAEPEPTIVMTGLMSMDRAILIGPYERRGDKYDEVLFVFYLANLPIKKLPDKMQLRKQVFPYPYERISYKDLRLDLKGNIYVYKSAIGYDKLQEAIRLIAAFEGWKRVPKPETALRLGNIVLWATEEPDTPVLATAAEYAAWIAPKVVP